MLKVRVDKKRSIAHNINPGILAMTKAFRETEASIKINSDMICGFIKPLFGMGCGDKATPDKYIELDEYRKIDPENDINSLKETLRARLEQRRVNKKLLTSSKLNMIPILLEMFELDFDMKQIKDFNKGLSGDDIIFYYNLSYYYLSSFPKLLSKRNIEVTVNDILCLYKLGFHNIDYYTFKEKFKKLNYKNRDKSILLDLATANMTTGYFGNFYKSVELMQFYWELAYKYSQSVISCDNGLDGALRTVKTLSNDLDKFELDLSGFEIDPKVLDPKRKELDKIIRDLKLYTSTREFNLDYIIDKVDVNPSLLADIKKEFNLKTKDPEVKYIEVPVIKEISCGESSCDRLEEGATYEEKSDFFRLINRDGNLYYVNLYEEIPVSSMSEVVPLNGVVELKKDRSSVIWNVGILTEEDFQGGIYTYKIRNGKCFKVVNGECFEVERPRITYSSYLMVFKMCSINMVYTMKKIGDNLLARDLINDKEVIINESNFTEELESDKVYIYNENFDLLKTYARQFYVQDRLYTNYRLCVLEECAEGLCLRDINSVKVVPVTGVPVYFQPGDIVEVDEFNEVIRKSRQECYLEEAPEFKRKNGRTKKFSGQCLGIKLAVFCHKTYASSLKLSLEEEGFEVKTFDGFCKKNSELMNLRKFEPDIVVYPVNSGSHGVMWGLKEEEEFTVVYPTRATKSEILSKLQELGLYAS